MSQIDTENDRTPKIFQFSMFLCLLSKVSTDFLDGNVEKGQQGKHVLSSMLSEEIKTKSLRLEISSIFKRNMLRRKNNIARDNTNYHAAMRCIKSYIAF